MKKFHACTFSPGRGPAAGELSPAPPYGPAEGIKGRGSQKRLVIKRDSITRKSERERICIQVSAHESSLLQQT